MTYQDLENELERRGLTEDVERIRSLIKREVIQTPPKFKKTTKQILEQVCITAVECRKENTPFPKFATVNKELIETAKELAQKLLNTPAPEPKKDDRRGTKRLASNADEAVTLLKQTIKEGTTMHVGHDRDIWIIHLVGLGGRSIMVQNEDLVGAMADVVGKWLRG